MNSPMHVLLFLLICLTSQSMCCQTDGQDLRDDNALMEQQAHDLNLTIDLHTISAEQDGITHLLRFGSGNKYDHGYTPYYVLNSDGSIDTGRSSPYASKRDFIMHKSYCQAHAIVIAQSNGSISHFTQDGHLIFTQTTFIVSDIIKPSEGISVNSTIVTLTPGGTVSWNGETFSLDIVGGASFSKNSHYLLFLSSPIGINRRFLLNAKDTISVTSTSLSPLGDNPKTFFPMHASLDGTKRKWKELISLVPCSQ